MKPTLATALAALAVFVLLAMALHAWWRSRRNAPRRAPRVVLDERVEPGLEAPAGDDPNALPEAGDTQPQPHPSVIAARRGARLDAVIDVLVPLVVESPLSGDFIAGHQPGSRRVGAKLLLIEGLDCDSGEWDAPTAGRRYSELQAGVQLASRSGALNEIEYSEFVQKVQAFADAIGAVPDFPDMLEVVARARELDAFAGPLDAVLTVTLRANQVAWSVGYLSQCAARLGFVPGAVPGRLVLPATEAAAPPILLLSFDPQAALAEEAQAAPVRECSLSLDVPQTDEKAEPFPLWHNAARTLADDMDAALVDDQGQPVTIHAFAAIGQELDKIYRALESRELAAGSAAARRLFS